MLADDVLCLFEVHPSNATANLCKYSSVIARLPFHVKPGREVRSSAVVFRFSKAQRPVQFVKVHSQHSNEFTKPILIQNRGQTVRHIYVRDRVLLAQ